MVAIAYGKKILLGPEISGERFKAALRIAKKFRDKKLSYINAISNTITIKW